MEDIRLNDLTGKFQGSVTYHDVSYNTRELVTGIVEDDGILDRERGNTVAVRYEDGLPEYYFGNRDRVRELLIDFLKKADCRVSNSTIELRLYNEKVEYAAVLCANIPGKDLLKIPQLEGKKE